MTTLAAVKKGKRLCLASDGMGIFGSRKEEFGKHVYKKGKWIAIGPNLVGISGHASWSLVLANYFSRRGTIPIWKTTDQIFELFNRIHEELKSEYYLTPPHLDYLPFESSEFQMLIINTYGIFEVEHSRVVRQYTKYTAIGTGEEYALGAISSVYDTIEDPQEIAQIAIAAASEFDRKTALPVQTYCLELR
jgi:ATP-dependent HslUV protease, peptidase subunit HslV